MNFLRLNKIINEAESQEVSVRYTNIDGNQSCVGEAWVSENYANVLFVNADNDKGGVHIPFENITDISIFNFN